MTIRHPIRYSSLFLLAFFLSVFFLSVPKGELSADDNTRETEICLDCHEGYAEGLKSSPHVIAREAGEGSEPQVACSDCHPGDSRHYEDDPEEYPRTNPAHLKPLAQAEMCATCHTNSHQQNMMEGNVHSANDVNCSDCHLVHGPPVKALLKADQKTLCMGCHTSVEAQFARPYRHPVADGMVECSECHMTLDVTHTDLSFNGTNTCVECHTEFKGPFPFEHPATLDYATEEGGCISCHDPHGSYLPRMLKQPYETPHNQLCSQCHAVPRHNLNQQHGTTWAGMACNECHTDIHGSYTNRNFLSEELQVLGCFNSGCHQF